MGGTTKIKKHRSYIFYNKYLVEKSFYEFCFCHPLVLPTLVFVLKHCNTKQGRAEQSRAVQSRAVQRSSIQKMQHNAQYRVCTAMQGSTIKCSTVQFSSGWVPLAAKLSHCPNSEFQSIFKESALGRFFHRVAMSVYIYICPLFM